MSRYGGWSSDVQWQQTGVTLPHDEHDVPGHRDPQARAAHVQAQGSLSPASEGRGIPGMVGSHVDLVRSWRHIPECDRTLPATPAVRSACSRPARPVRLVRPAPRALALQRLAVRPRELP